MRILSRAPNRSSSVSTRSGCTLPTVMIMSLVIAIAGFHVLRTVVFESDMAHRSHYHQQALGLAKSGVEAGIFKLSQMLLARSSPSTSTTLPISSAELNAPLTLTGNLSGPAKGKVGDYTVSITASVNNRRTIDSISYIPSFADSEFSRRVRVTVEMPNSPCDWGIYSYSHMKFDQNFVMDSYDSTVGPYGVDGNVNTNGDIGGGEGVDAYYNYSTVNGDIQVGGSVTYGGYLNVTGDVSENDPAIPPPPFPDDELAAAKLSNDNNQIHVDGVPFAGGTELKPDAEATITIPPGVYFFSSIILQRDSVIEAGAGW